MAKKFTAEALNYVVGECLLRLRGVQVPEDAEGTYISLRASALSAVFRTIPEDNKKSLV